MRLEVGVGAPEPVPPRVKEHGPAAHVVRAQGHLVDRGTKGRIHPHNQTFEVGDRVER